jgi:hypothetical protein
VTLTTAGIVHPGQDPLRAACELHERLLQLGEIAVALEVVRLDVVDHRYRGRERQERFIVFVSLDHEKPVAADSSVPPPLVHPASRPPVAKPAAVSASVVMTVVGIAAGSADPHHGAAHQSSQGCFGHDWDAQPARPVR